MNRQPSRCLLVEDLPSTSQWMQDLVREAFPGLDVTAVATLKSAAAELDGALERKSPFAFAVIDLGLPDGSGVDLVRKLVSQHPGTPAIVATIFDDDDHLFAALSAGARGYLLKSDDFEHLVRYVRRIEQGEPSLSPTIAHRILSHFRTSAPLPDDAVLTPREVDILRLLSQGFTIAETAARLSLKPQTIASYVKVIYQKLNISSRAEATREAIRRGLS